MTGAARGSVDVDLGSWGLRSHQVDINSLEVPVPSLFPFVAGELFLPAAAALIVSVSLVVCGAVDLPCTNPIYCLITFRSILLYQKYCCHYRQFLAILHLLPLQ